jgi:hypothetical protein
MFTKAIFDLADGPVYLGPSGEQVKIVYVSKVAKVTVYFGIAFDEVTNEYDLRDYRADELRGVTDAAGDVSPH